MEKCVNIVFIGGDDRAAFASAYLCQMGYEVGYCSCKSQKFSSAVKIENVCDAVEFADVIVLPIPVTRDSQSVSYSDGALLSLILNDISKDKKMLVFGGMIANELEEALKKSGVKAVDYAKNEAYLQSAAELTVLAFQKFLFDREAEPLDNKRVAVCGLGRIGKKLVSDLCRRNARVTVLSGKSNAYTELDCENVSIYHYNDAKDVLGECEVVINTAPAHVLDISAVKAIPKDSILYELASAPFGIDQQSEQYLAERYVKALGLPGIYYPKEAGELIARSVLETLQSEYGL